MQPRKQKILNDLKDVMSDLGGLDRDKIADQSTFLELGFDSLFLAQMSAAFKKKFAVNVTFRQLLEEVPSPEALAHYIDSQLPSEVVPISEPQEPIGRTKPVTPSCEMSLPRPISRSIQSFSASVTQTANPKADQVQISSSAFERTPRGLIQLPD